MLLMTGDMHHPLACYNISAGSICLQGLTNNDLLAMMDTALMSGNCVFTVAFETELTNIVFAALHADHLDSWVLNGGGAVALQGLHWLVGHPLAVNSQGGNILPLVGQQHLVSWLDLLRVCVKDNWQPKEQTILHAEHEV